MKRIDEDTIQLTQSELSTIEDFIWNTLYRQWDHYTDHVISDKPRLEGMRYMNEVMFDMQQEMMRI